MEMLLVRHGRPQTEHDDGADGADGADPELSERGLAEATQLAEHLAGGAVPTPGFVWCSPMLRARRTAEEIAERAAAPLRVDGRLREFDAGATSYVPVEETGDGTDHSALWSALETGVWGTHRFDPDAFERRVQAAFADVVAEHPGAVVAVVCHAGVMNSYLGTVLGRPRGMFCRFDYTSFSRVLASREGHLQVHSLNETAHLQLVRD